MENERVRTCIDTEFEVNGRRHPGTIRNISEGGLFVSTASVPDEGETVEVTFMTPSGREMSLSGLVWWTATGGIGEWHRAPGFGLRLLDENEELRGLLAKL